MSIKTTKRGLSPVIATVLLITLAVLLAAIIFLWAKQFIGETVSKSGEVIENSCPNVQFAAEISSSLGSISVENKGGIPLYGVNLKKVSAGETTDLGNPFTNLGPEVSITGGQTSSVFVSGVNVGDNFIVTPVLLGLDDQGNRRAYTCDEKFKEDITAI